MSYSFKGRVRYSEIGEDGCLTLPGIQNYYQDCCTFQSEEIGQGMEVLEERQRAWVLSSWQIVVNRYPGLGETIVASTAPYGFKGFLGMRNFTLKTEDGELLSYANSIWTNIDTETGLPARLTDEEFAVMKQHSVFGYHMLQERNEFNNDICMAVLQHHEKINGNGYPLGFDAPRITPYARILAVADIYDALVTERPYKKAFSQKDAIELIMSMTEELDIKAMKSFLESIILYPVDSIVELSNGEKAKVVSNNNSYILRPTVVGITSGRVYNLGEDMDCANIVII